MKSFDDLLNDALDNNKLWAKLYWQIENLFFVFKYRIFIRGKCAFKGCDVHYCSNWNMPEDVSEWHCSRCDAEGINWQVITSEIFYSDSKIHNLWDALRGK